MLETLACLKILILMLLRLFSHGKTYNIVDMYSFSCCYKGVLIVQIQLQPPPYRRTSESVSSSTRSFPCRKGIPNRPLILAPSVKHEVSCSNYVSQASQADCFSKLTFTKTIPEDHAHSQFEWSGTNFISKIFSQIYSSLVVNVRLDLYFPSPVGEKVFQSFAVMRITVNINMSSSITPLVIGGSVIARNIRWWPIV